MVNCSTRHENINGSFESLIFKKVRNSKMANKILNILYFETVLAFWR
jgi:hypothetical protein